MPKASTVTAPKESHRDGPSTLKGSTTSTPPRATLRATEKAVDLLLIRHHINTPSRINARCVGREKPAMPA
jgi:hypothetical protein